MPIRSLGSIIVGLALGAAVSGVALAQEFPSASVTVVSGANGTVTVRREHVVVQRVNVTMSRGAASTRAMGVTVGEYGRPSSRSAAMFGQRNVPISQMSNICGTNFVLLGARASTPIMGSCSVFVQPFGVGFQPGYYLASGTLVTSTPMTPMRAYAQPFTSRR